MTEELQDHPIASIFPLLEGREFDELVEDIRANGVQVPIVIYEGKILDGRNRYRAGIKAAQLVPQNYYTGDDPISHAASLNLHRRHLTPTQLAEIARKSLPHFEEEARKRQTLGKSFPKVEEAGKATERAAKTFGVNPRYIADAKMIAEKAPDLSEKLASGEMSIPKAKAEVAKRADPIKEPELNDEQEQRVADAEMDSETLWKLKTLWRKASKKDRAAFRAWEKAQ